MQNCKILLALILVTFLFSCGNGTNELPPEERLQDDHMMDDGHMMDDDDMIDNGHMMEDDTLHDDMMYENEENGDFDHGMMGPGMMSNEMQRAMMSQNMGPEMMEDMQNIRTMLMNHEEIDRRVENLENGVKTWTTSSDPRIASAIQVHVRQMKERMEEQRPIRQMDPLFREIFKHADKIEMQIENIENGVTVIEVSADPQVVKLIKQHANEAISEFARYGMSRAMQPTPLPEGYQQ